MGWGEQSWSGRYFVPGTADTLSWKLLSILKSVIPSFENQFSYQISKNNKKQNNNDDTTLLELYEALHAYHYHLCLHHVVGTLIHVP